MPPPPKPKVRKLTTITKFFTAKVTPTVTATPSPPTTSTYYFIDVFCSNCEGKMVYFVYDDLTECIILFEVSTHT